MKRCNTCGEFYPRSSVYFRVNSRRADGLGNICKNCKKKKDALYRERNREAIRKQSETYKKTKRGQEAAKKTYEKSRKDPWRFYIDFEYRLCRTFNITIEDYIKMMNDQKGCCAACGCSLIDKRNNRNPSIDHNHSTGKVRGLLCSNCNVTIGYSLEDTDRLLACIEYLKRNTNE